jgi:tRNA A-37 threonylcarbamoyl transferase component Bud32/uncharacterized Tic20 family protein
MIGTQIGDYQITERVGSGGFATVYKAQDTKSGQPVALKILREQYVEDELFIERFRNEAETIRSLPDNPHIVKPIDYGKVGKTYYLAMEFLEGQDLDRVLLQQGALPIDQAVDIAGQIADALAVAHSKQVVHRDVKPQNVKLMPSGTAKMLDFGIARATEDTHLTQTGTFIGTPPYMAPEIWEGQDASPRTDIYSLGVVLYEMIAGHPPFQADNPAAIMRQHLFEEPRPLNVVRVDTPPRIAWTVTRCLAKSPADRYASAGELLAALQGDVEVTAPEPAVARPRPKPKRPPVPFSILVRRRMEPVVKRATSLLSRLPELARGQPRAYLEGRAGRMAGYRFRLSGQNTVLGQADNCAIPLGDRYLSPHHARVYFFKGRYYLYDLNSYNGTYLNGYRLTRPYPLEHGDQIQIGECIFTFLAPSARPAAGVYQGTRSAVSNQLMAVAGAHASVVLIPLIAPALIWAMYKDRSPYVSHQAKQALLYQGVYVVLLFLRGISLFRFVSPAIIWLLAAAGGCYAAYRCYRGQPFVYPILGELAIKF